jgi:hypothetical protein
VFGPGLSFDAEDLMLDLIRKIVGALASQSGQSSVGLCALPQVQLQPPSANPQDEVIELLGHQDNRLHGDVVVHEFYKGWPCLDCFLGFNDLAIPFMRGILPYVLG